MNRTLAGGAAALLLLPLAACDGGDVTQASSTSSSPSSSSSSESSSAGSSSESTSSGSESSSASDTAGASESSSSGSASETGSASESASGDSMKKYGDSVTYKNGVKITVGKPSAYTPDKYSSAKDKWPAFAKFPVTLVNGSDKPVSANKFYVNATAGTVESGNIYGDGLGQPDSTVLPGKTISWNEAFGYKKGDELIVEVKQFMDYDDDTEAFFVGKP